MPDATEPNQNSGSLDSRVGTLLKEALDAAGRVETELEPQAAPVTALADAKPASASPSRPGDHVSIPAATAERHEDSDIGKLDDDLARLTESLITNETVSPGGTGVTPPSGAIKTAPPPPPAAGKVATPAPASAATGTSKTEPPPPAPAATTATSTPSAPVESDVTTAPSASLRESAPSVSSSSTPTAPSRSLPSSAPAENAPSSAKAAAVPDRVKPSLARVAAGTAPIALAGLAAVSKPLLSKPRVFRDTVGWLAIWTLFLATCVWGYRLFVHKPAPPEARTSPIELVTQERPPAVAAHDEAAPKSEHVESKHEPAAHDAPQHAEGHH